MYLFSIEGGDGSGKGLATKIVAEVLERDFAFSSVEVTGEPRREHPLGRLAIDSVRRKKMSPEQEAGLFAADRLDHSHGWILPRLKEGRAVVSERNVHSSLVYQGIVGDLGVNRVAHLNSASLIPDLCIWVDCDPEIAIGRIRNETLRGLSNKEEYFETTKLQRQIRSGYKKLLSGEIHMPVPFDMGAVVGPIVNEGSVKDFRKEITQAVRAFMHSRPTPVNVDMELVDQYMLSKLVKISSGQSRLREIGLKPPKNNSEWLGGNPPWKALLISQQSHEMAISATPEESPTNLPKNTLNHSITSICGTLSLLHAANVSELRAAMGPVRCVSERHTQRILKFLNSNAGWIFQHRSLIGKDAPRSQLKDEFFSFGMLSLAIWPFRRSIRKWQLANPKTHIRFCLGQLVRSGKHASDVSDSLERLSILGSGSSAPNPSDEEGLVDWWLGKS